jgi:glycosyltransferase involved in cell wall biosynthesis
MKIVVDFRKYDGVVGGVERAVLEVSRQLGRAGHQLVLLPKASRLAEVRQELAGVPNLAFLPLDVRSHVMSLRNAWIDGARIQDIADRVAADVVYHPYNWSFPYRKRAPTVLTVHDVIPLTFREAMGLARNRLLYRPGMRLACRLNDRVVTVSQFSKQDMARRLGVAGDKIRVIPNGIRAPHPPRPSLEADLLRRFDLQRGFVLYVGGIHERKNVPRLIAAFARLARGTGYPGSLLVTGRVAGAPYQERMRRVCEEAVRRSGMEGRVTFTGFISDEELDTLLRRATCLAYPSLYEGFGIPVLEAMNAGTPVLTSSTTALPEVADGAALLVDPLDEEAMAAGLAHLIADPHLRASLARAGRQWAASFTWERTAGAYLDLFIELSTRASVGRTQVRPPGRA